MLELNHVSLSFGEKVILDDVSFRIEAGEIVGIIGKSGMGKTSLIKVMSALMDASAGSVVFDGKTLIGPSQKLIPGYEDLQVVNQDFALDPYHTVEENVREKVLHLPKDERNDLIDEVLDLTELSALKSRKAHTLSGGEQQRLALARALACEPLMLLLDEPFVHLDQALRYRMMHYLLRLNEVRNTTIVIVSHDGVELMGFVKRMIHLKNGKIERDDTPSVFYYEPQDEEQAELLGTINQLEVEGQIVLFRPNEYAFEGSGRKIEVVFQRSINTGLLVLNYFLTKSGTNIVLSATRELNTLTYFFLQKHGETQS
jgi:iron(III) transport system ATP-binding protein